MMKRPKPGEGEEDILRMQEEFLKEKEKNKHLQPAAQVTSLRCLESTKRPSTSESGRKPSKYAQSKGLKGSEKRPRTDKNPTCSVLGDILEKNINEEVEVKLPEIEDDKVYFPKLIPSVLGNIVEKNFDDSAFVEKPMPPTGFPEATKRNPNIKPGNKSIYISNLESKLKNKTERMDVDEPTSSKTSETEKPNLPPKSFILSSNDADDIHKENINLLTEMSEKDILEEQQKLLTSLDPKLVEFIKNKRKSRNIKMDTTATQSTEKMDIIEERGELERDSLWENDVLSHPQVSKWLHFESLEKDKLQWMKGIEESKKFNSNEPYEARFDFKGYLLPYIIEYTEKTKTLFHHGEEPHRPGYSLTELFELSRSTVMQQRVMALKTIAGIVEYYSAGTYKDIIEIPLSKIFFVIRIALDENKLIILEPALKALRNLMFNRIDEACLDALLGFNEGTQQPCLENDKSEIEELESKESELNDYHLAEIDLISAILRTDILQRLYYILDVVKPGFNCVQYALQILTRLSRDSVNAAATIIESDHLMKTIVNYFIPTTSINFKFEPEIVYNGKPILAAIKLIRILSLQSEEIGLKLIKEYDILRPISEYVCSGVDGTYGLRIQIEAFSVLSNLLTFNLGVDNALSLFPITVTSLYKHVQGTDIFFSSSIISATHAAVILQYINNLLNRNVNLEINKNQIYPLIKEGTQKWIGQLSMCEGYTCGHLRLLCAILDCCKTILLIEDLPIKVLIDSLRILFSSRGYKEIIKNICNSSNLLSGIENNNLHFVKNLKCLGTSVINSAQKVLPILNVTSPIPFLASLANVLVILNDRDTNISFLKTVSEYMQEMAKKSPSLCDNWFTRIETDLVFSIIKLTIQSDLAEDNKDLTYTVANKLCYILRIDKKVELDYIFTNIVFNKTWFTADRLMNLVSLSDVDGFSKALTSIDDIRKCYTKAVNFNYIDVGPNVVLRKWQEPILPRDWIYLPILMLYSKSQEIETGPKVVGELAKKVAVQKEEEKENIIRCSLEWILLNELCFQDLLNDIDVTDRFCRIMCVFLCDNSLFLDKKIKILLRKCTQIIFKKKSALNFDKPLTGLHNFQDFYTQFLEQFQSVSYGDPTFAACVLVPLAQRHNVKWRKILWSEYAGCLRALDCQEDICCYDINDYLYPEETDESLLQCYCKALASNLLRPNTIAYKIAAHHANVYKTNL